MSAKSRGVSSSKSSLQSDDTELKRQYTALRRKYDELYNETFKLSESLYESQMETKRLRREKKFLLDTISKMEKRTFQRGSRKPSSDAAKALQSVLAALTESKKTSSKVESDTITLSEINDLDSSVGTSHVESAAPADMQTCTAVLGPGRVCKTKRNPGSMYCWRHAALDPNSGIIWCKYEDPFTHKKCSNSIPKTKKPLLCGQHTHKANLFLDDDSVMNGATREEITALVSAKAVPHHPLEEE